MRKQPRSFQETALFPRWFSGSETSVVTRITWERGGDKGSGPALPHPLGPLCPIGPDTPVPELKVEVAVSQLWLPVRVTWGAIEDSEPWTPPQRSPPESVGRRVWHWKF